MKLNTGYSKPIGSNNYVLLAGGGHKALSEFSTAGNSDTVDNFHANDFEGCKLTIIDTTTLDENTWYPVTMALEASKVTRIKILGRTQATATWNVREDKQIALYLDYESTGSSWGWNKVCRRIYDYSEGAGSPGNLLGGIGLLEYGAIEYIYVRGGSIYNFYLSSLNIVPILRTETYTLYGQSISPTTTQPEKIVRNLLQYDDIKSKLLHLSGGTMTGTITFGEINDDITTTTPGTAFRDNAINIIGNSSKVVVGEGIFTSIQTLALNHLGLIYNYRLYGTPDIDSFLNFNTALLKLALFNSGPREAIYSSEQIVLRDERRAAETIYGVDLLQLNFENSQVELNSNHLKLLYYDLTYVELKLDSIRAVLRERSGYYGPYKYEFPKLNGTIVVSPNELSEITKPLLDNTIYKLSESVNLLDLESPETNNLGCVIYFTSSSSGCTISYSVNTYWIGNLCPRCEANKKYMITVLDGIFKLDEYTELY